MSEDKVKDHLARLAVIAAGGAAAVATFTGIAGAAATSAPVAGASHVVASHAAESKARPVVASDNAQRFVAQQAVYQTVVYSQFGEVSAFNQQGGPSDPFSQWNQQEGP